jgi:hypothetical protein
MRRWQARFPAIIGPPLLIAGIAVLMLAQPASARSAFPPQADGPDLSNVIINLSDLPPGFEVLEGSQLSSMEGMLESAKSSLSRITKATLQNVTGYTVRDPQNLQLVISGLIAPLSSDDQAEVDRELSDTESIEKSLGSAAGSGELRRLEGSDIFGDISMGVTMTMGSGSIKLRMDYIVVRRQMVLEEVGVMYLDGKQPSISALQVTRIVDGRVADVVGGGAGTTFRAEGPLAPELTTHIPAPQDISTKPGVIGANLFLAALIMLPFAIAAEFFTRTLAENEESLRKKFFPLDWTAGLQRRLSQLIGSHLHHPGLMDLIKLIGVMCFYGLVFSLLEHTWNPFSLQGLVLFVQMTIAYGIVGIADDILQWRVIRQWGFQAELTVRPTNLMLAVVSTATSRLFSVVPGLMFGTPEALHTDEAALDSDKQNRLLRISAITFTVIILIFWIPTIVTGLLLQLSLPTIVADLIGGLEAFLLVVFAVALENTFVQILGFPGGFGLALKRRNRWLWLAGLVAVTFLFFHTLINPRGELASAIQEGNVLVLMAAAGAFLAVSFGLWVFVGRRGGTHALPSLASTGIPAIHSPIVTQGASTAAARVLPDTVVPASASSISTPVAETISGDAKKCPSCGGTIKAEARLCRFCRATFEVVTKGYCLNCHEIQTTEDGRCTKCGKDVMDGHIESTMRTRPSAPPRPVPSSPAAPTPPATPGDTRRCPACGQTIKVEAKVCRFCRTRFDNSAPPSAPPPKTIPLASQPEEVSSPYGPAHCPKCKGSLEAKKGSPVSPYINTYLCGSCGWMGLQCGSTGCDGYMRSQEIGMPGSVRYTCVKCGWTGTGPRI